MHEVTLPDAVRSLGVFVGAGACDARCSHCAGMPHRRYSPRHDGDIDGDLVSKTLRECHARGARSLSLTGSGEPTLSPITVTRALSIVEDLAREGVVYSSIHLYTNGIRIGTEKTFCDEYLPSWRGKGLDTLYITVHDIDERENARVYGVPSYPSLPAVFSRAHDAGLSVRANMMLSRGTVHTLDRFVESISYLRRIGADRVAAWPIRGMDDRPDRSQAPSPEEFDMMRDWARRNGGRYHVSISGEEDGAIDAAGQKLTLFPDGSLSSDWCNGKG